MHLLLSAALLTSVLAAPVAETQPVDLVRPFVGTENFGNTFPGASAPFGMVQVSPDTGGQGGYDYRQNTIYGFSQTHLSGVGCGVAGELPIMPTTGAISSVDPNVYKSEFSHDDESASPGHYRVGLHKYDVDAELTATARTGWQRYTFPATAAANVLFNTGKANQSVFDSEIHVVDDRTIEGRVEAGNFCAGQDDHTVFFTASFDRPFSSYGTWRGTSVTAGSRDAAGAGSNGAYVTFDATTDRDVVVKVGLSYTGMAGARANLAAETSGFDFAAVRDALRAQWVTALDRVKIGGGTEERRAAFYTALYHSLLHPNVAGDVDGSYVGFDRAVHKAEGYTPYQNFSLWDTYRPQNQLLELLTPDVARDVALSVLAIGRDGGWLPRWALANSETNIMTGDPVTPFLVEAWSKGLLKGHESTAYELLRKNALSEPPADSPYNGRTGIKYYSDRGYIPSGLELGTDCVHKGGDNDCVHPASATLEYSAADASLALMAQGLGKTADARLFAARGQWYRNLWDSSTQQFRPRTTDGTWLTPYDPVAAAQQFHEGGAYQYQWLVPQDPSGLVQLMGGRAATARRLDSFFAYDKLLKDPAGTARNDWIASPYDYYAKPTYNPNNEPDLLAPYMYHWAGAPARTATVVRAAMTLFTTGPDGMTGNDDLGTMSAWYVFSSLGLYPTMSGANFLAVSSPQFPSAVVRTGDRTLTVTAPGASDTNRYIQRVRVNGSSLTKNWVPWSAVGSGGTIAHTLGTSPSSWGTSAAAEPPSVNRAPLDNRTALSAAIRPASAAVPPGGSATLTVDIVGQAPGTLRPQVTVVDASGFRTEVRQPGPIVSRHLPTSATATVTVTAPASVAPGTYPLTVDVSGVRKSANLIVTTPSVCSSAVTGQCAVVLTPTRDGTATVAASDSGNFDGGGWSYDAGLLPPAGPVTWSGVTYAAPDPAGTAPNFTSAAGRTLLLPAGSYTSANLVLTSHNGPVGSSVTIGYTDGTYASVPVTIADWCGTAAAGTTAVLAMPHRIKAGQGVDGPPVSLFGARLALAEGKQIRSITLPDDARVYVYALTLA
ncbi:alpha-1,2-mannosidase [Paractinoplanes abujensis]|uniref:Putative alpha-1,2-mannosidase n=1 Tax=Paractinoplanes abujensis TaxID=882441 RepID=A0A7W7CZV4_9ACTN|nr:GH92 family glycosyl hydrolase [Actinoplanes abujensis]MBB4697727.1 putative alpha-1,2-mannosidase [Actinoplanes abujensis]GID19786.1 alpha-1,2-mannosidase [Actinoplanes abujensis]